MISLKEALERTIKAGPTPPHPDGGLFKDEAHSDGDRIPIAHAAQDDQEDAATTAEDAVPPVTHLAEPTEDVATTAEEATPPVEHPKEPVVAPEEESFAALELRDRVVIMLLFDQIVTEAQVAQVWALWQQEYWGDIKTPLWRLLTLIPELDRELILAEAARVYGIEEARIAYKAVVPVIKKLALHAPAPLWEKMVNLRLMPIAEAEQKHKHRMQLVFVSHDPTHPEVKGLIAELGVDAYELRYASEYKIIELLTEVFPEKYSALKKVLKKERERFVKAMEDEPIRDASLLALEPEESLEEPEATTQEIPLNTSSIISFFEELLVEAVRSGATGVCLVPNKNEKSEAYALVNEELKPWCLIEHIPPELLFSTLKSAIIRADISLNEENKKQIIDRWIDGTLVHFRVLALPAGAMLDREAIVFRVLK